MGQVEEIETHTTIVENPLSVILKPSRQKKIVGLSRTVSYLYLIGFYRALYPLTAQNTFLSSLGTFSKIGHIMDHKTHFDKLKKNRNHTKYVLRQQ